MSKGQGVWFCWGRGMNFCVQPLCGPPPLYIQLTWAWCRYNENKLGFVFVFVFIFRRKMSFAALNSLAVVCILNCSKMKRALSLTHIHAKMSKYTMANEPASGFCLTPHPPSPFSSLETSTVSFPWTLHRSSHHTWSLKGRFLSEARV